MENLPKGRHGSGGFFGGFLRWIFLVAKCKRKIRRKNSPENPPAENKNLPAHNLPEIHQPGPKIRRKSYQQIRLSNLQVHAELFFRLRKLLLEASSEHGFWDTLWLLSGHGRGSHTEMPLQSLSCCWLEGQGLLRSLPVNTFLITPCSFVLFSRTEGRRCCSDLDNSPTSDMQRINHSSKDLCSHIISCIAPISHGFVSVCRCSF